VERLPGRIFISTVMILTRDLLQNSKGLAGLAEFIKA
jgi:hypothetical protein